jgi:hypothetical protein
LGLDTELEHQPFTGPQLQLFAADPVLGQGLLGPPIEAEKVGILECHGVPQREQMHHHR